MRKAFRWALLRRGPGGADRGGILHQAWLAASKSVGRPLDYVCFVPTSRAPLTSAQLQDCVRRVFVEFNIIEVKGGKAVMNGVNAGDMDIGIMAGI